MATICGRVASATNATNANRQPTFLNLDKPYPNHIFTAVIWGSDRSAFPYVPESLADRRICVTGTIRVYRGKAEIIVSGPNQIQTSE
jgi:nuclease S1